MTKKSITSVSPRQSFVNVVLLCFFFIYFAFSTHKHQKNSRCFSFSHCESLVATRMTICSPVALVSFFFLSSDRFHDLYRSICIYTQTPAVTIVLRHVPFFRKGYRSLLDDNAPWGGLDTCSSSSISCLVFIVRNRMTQRQHSPPFLLSSVSLQVLIQTRLNVRSKQKKEKKTKKKRRR